MAAAPPLLPRGVRGSRIEGTQPLGHGNHRIGCSHHCRGWLWTVTAVRSGCSGLGWVVLPEDYPAIEATVRSVLHDLLGLSTARVAGFTDRTPLFGALSELDSMAVAGLLTELEERLGILIDDDEVDGEMLETFGALVRFAASKATG